METCHIGILGFTLFPENPDFYSEYRIMNQRTQQYYTDKFCLRVLDLTQINKADETTDQKLIKWARIFRAKSEKELLKLVGNEEVFQEMAVIIKELNEDEKIRLQCEARFFYECDLASTRAEGFEEGVRQEKMRSEKIIKELQEQIKQLKKKYME